MKNLFLAKSNHLSEQAETIEIHTKNLLYEFEQLQVIYPDIPYLNWRLLKYACMYHDVGKANTKFQNKLLNIMRIKESLDDVLPGYREIPHGYLSCAFIPFGEFSDIEDKKIVAQAVFFHHHRPAVEGTEFRETIQKDLILHYKELQNHLSFPISEPKFNFTRFTSKRISRDTDSHLLLSFIMVKGLLNKIDHAASAGIPVEVMNPGLTSSLDQYFTNVLQSEPNELQKYMKAHQDDNNIIVASTGIGKTEGALYWIGNHKGFFHITFTCFHQ